MAKRKQLEAAQKRLDEHDPAAQKREDDRNRMRAARHGALKPSPKLVPRKIGNKWRLVKDLPLRDDQVAGDASKHEMAALAARVAPTLTVVPFGTRTRAPVKVDKRGKLIG